MALLEDIIAKGNRGHFGYIENSVITCADGFHMSVIAGGGTYCQPRPQFCSCWYRVEETMGAHTVLTTNERDVRHDYRGPYTHVEVGFPSERPEPWGEWHPHCEGDIWKETVYGYVPVEMVRALVALHGGEKEEA